MTKKEKTILKAEFSAHCRAYAIYINRNENVLRQVACAALQATAILANAFGITWDILTDTATKIFNEYHIPQEKRYLPW